MNFKRVGYVIKKCDRVIDAKLENLQSRVYGKHRHRYYRFLYHMILLHKPRIAIEIGVDKGLGSAHMAIAAKEYGGHVIGIDPFDNRIFNFEKYPYTFIEDKCRNTRIQLKELTQKYGEIGFVFQDSSHHYLESIKEWNTMTDMLSDNAIWICNNVNSELHNSTVDSKEKDMIKYFEQLPGRKKLYDRLHKGSVIGVVLL